MDAFNDETPHGQEPAVLGGCGCEHIKGNHPNLTTRQLVAQILREYERRGDAMRCLNKWGMIIWKASPRFLSMLEDAERDALDDLNDWP
jgi:hypothetical protein